MLKKNHVKLGEGRSLFHPNTRILIKKDEKFYVPVIQFWNRRLKDGDLVLVDSDISTIPKIKEFKKIKDKKEK